jgi:hypothetical protein
MPRDNGSWPMYSGLSKVRVPEGGLCPSPRLRVPVSVSVPVPVPHSCAWDALRCAMLCCAFAVLCIIASRPGPTNALPTPRHEPTCGVEGQQHGMAANATQACPCTGLALSL